MLKRFIAVFLVCVFLFGASACKKSDNGETGESSTSSFDGEETESEETGSEGESSDTVDSGASSKSSEVSSKKPPTGKEKRMVWWLPDVGVVDETASLMEKALDEFEKKTGIGVDLYIHAATGGSLTPFDSKFIPAMSAGNGPDITSFNYINPNYAMDITNSFDNAFWDQFFVSVKDSLKLNGKYYSTPGELSVSGLLTYSKVDFKNAGLDPNSPPTTIAQLDEFAEKLYLPKGDKYTQVGFQPWDWLMLEYPILMVKPFGGSWVNAEGYPTANAAGNVAALEWVKKYTNKYGYAKVNDSLSGLKNEKNDYGHALAMKLDFGAGINAMATNNYKSNEWGITVFPGASSGQNGLSLGLSAGYSAVKNCKNPQAATEFLKFMATDYQTDYYVKNYKVYRAYSCNQAAWKKHLKSMDEFTVMLYNQVLSKSTAKDFGNQITLTKYSAPANYDALIKASLTKIITGKAEVKAELDALQNKVVAQTKTN